MDRDVPRRSGQGGDGDGSATRREVGSRISPGAAHSLKGAPVNITGEHRAPRKALLDKVRKFQGSKEVSSLGLYPYFRCIQSCQNPEVLIDGRTYVMLGSNNYLGLVSDRRVIEAARAAAQRYGTGCAGSRLLNGTLDIHEELERRLADFVRKEAALLYSTGYQANLGAIATLAT